MLTPLQKLYNEVKDLPCSDEAFKTKVIDRIFEIHTEEVRKLLASAIEHDVCALRLTMHVSVMYDHVIPEPFYCEMFYAVPHYLYNYDPRLF